MKNPFRYGCVVSGEHFCPRPKLERELRAYAESGQNVVIQGERRMGKTSLVKKAISGMRGERLLYIDLYCIKTMSDFCQRVMNGVSGASDKMPFLRKALALAHRLRPALTIDPMSGTPSITIDTRAAAEPDSLAASMNTIKKLANDGGICVVFDEFQDILKLHGSDRILAEMRSTIQFQADTPYFFLGSVRNDMLKIFTHYESPFFKSALPFEVGEIDMRDFIRFLIERFRKGARKISPETAESVIRFAHGVSGDVQELCDALWEITEEHAEISDSDIGAALEVVFSREKNGFESFVTDLTPNQFSVLNGLAKLNDARVYTSEFMNHVCMTSPGAVKRALTKLESMRLIYVYRSQYRFTNPFFREWLIRHF